MFKRLLASSVIGLVLSTAVYADNLVQSKEVADRFAFCDKNHDGKLTRDEAKGCMPRVYEHFSYLDPGNTGYLTIAQIEKKMAK